MLGDSPELLEWLKDLSEAAEGDEGDSVSRAPEIYDLDEDEGDEDPVAERVIWSFPNDSLLEEFLSNIHDRSAGEVETVLSCLLIPSCTTYRDHSNFEMYLSLKQRGDPNLPEMFKSRHARRVLRYHSGATDQLPWEGITWVLDLLPRDPNEALAGLEAYFRAHMWHLSDSMIHAISDAEKVIRARYISVPSTDREKLNFLLALSFREFEQVVEHLYDQMGYATELTPPGADGGRDVIATKTKRGHAEKTYIECKRHDKNIGVMYVRALAGVVGKDMINKGVLVTTAGFTLGAEKWVKDDSRIELIGGRHLVELLNEYLGFDWPTRLGHLAKIRPIRARGHAAN